MTETPGWSAPDAQPPPEQAAPRTSAPVVTTPAPEAETRVLPLRPLTVGEVLDGSVDVLRTHAKIVFTASVAVAVVTQLVVLAFTLPFVDDLNVLGSLDPDTVTPDQYLQQLTNGYFAVFGGSLAGQFAKVLGLTVMSGFMSVIVGRSVLGQSITPREVWAEFRPRLGAVLGVSALFTLMVGAGLFLCFLPGVALWVMFALAVPALALERCGAGRSLSRSMELLKHNGWPRVLGVLALSYVVSLILENVITVPFAAVGLLDSFLRGGPELLTATTLVASAVGGVIAVAVTTPFHAGVTAILYVDRRMRGEGLDIDLRRAAGHAPG
ncbi:hypothetical protein LFM09_47600 [Lentzea alba]|uniref:hypothetical protein n=1 Tax=Lentzea alba TaxID=2714351 RepID=UPI0039BFF436